jgi:hypothetical protein
MAISLVGRSKTASCEFPDESCAEPLAASEDMMSGLR